MPSTIQKRNVWIDHCSGFWNDLVFWEKYWDLFCSVLDYLFSAHIVEWYADIQCALKKMPQLIY